MKRLSIFIFALFLLSGCAQWRAKHVGGTDTIRLDPGLHLVNIAWKDTTLWVLTAPREPGTKAQTYTFKESSLYGVFEGTITVIEQ